MIFCQFILTSDSSELLVFFCYEITFMFGIIVCGSASTFAHKGFLPAWWSTSLIIVVRSLQMAHAGSQGGKYLWVALYDWYGRAKVGCGFVKSSDGLIC